MKTILVPVDGSDFSKRALLKAKELADQLGSKILLINVVNIKSAISYYHFSPRLAQDSMALDWREIISNAKEDSLKLLEESKELLKGSNVETFVIDKPGSDLSSLIVEFADEHEVDMIVMGSNGMGSLTRRIYLGSVTTKVLHTTQKPVLVVQ